ncbi:hypothetical protein H8N03_04810 [Ramlibacter sp. USB13]|uniref:Uncharacterized protein n=1 Tax=Ramlibacter cellulosilyticus TaxID=2764187 RepID=A0A923MQC9_9BURK|nr:hypothetical protein [Ramlibacter cellulosilyticus]MBC5782254.1 hypothetical protein [Ramlibacter cellulosilyticus]
MPTFAAFKASFARKTPAAPTVPADPKKDPRAVATAGARKACQSLCLGCDARTPCTLGRLIG